MTEQPTETADHRFIILNPEEQQVWLDFGPAGVALPHIRHDQRIWFPVADRLQTLFRPLWQPAGHIVRYVNHKRRSEAHHESFVWLLAAPGPAALRGPGRWVNRNALAGLTWTRPEEFSWLEEVWAESAPGRTPARRAPWAEPGWFPEAAAWMRDQVAALGRPATGPAEQVKLWSISCILRLPTAEGYVYLKAVADQPPFVNEARVMAWLAQRFPAYVPAPLALDLERRWLLLPDLGPLRSWDDAASTIAPLHTVFGRLQRAAVADVPALLAQGCNDRRPGRLADLIDPFLADPVTAQAARPADLAGLRALAPQLKALCARLAASGLPDTLIHGDLHLGNVAQWNGRLVLFDWTDTAVAHPFVDMMAVYFDVEDADEVQRLRDEYLALWTDYAGLDALRASWDLARPLTALNQAISYQLIIRGAEARCRWELRGGLEYFAGLLLQATRDYLAQAGLETALSPGPG